MTVEEFIREVEDKLPPAPASELAAFEASIGARLPDDYRTFLINCNGGYVGGRYWFEGPTRDGRSGGPGVHHVGGLRADENFSLVWALDCYRGRIPASFIPIIDDPFGNEICLGIAGAHRGRVYFWDHETAGSPDLLADSFTAFVAGLRELKD